MKHRLYVDEVGNPDLGASEDPNRRYLSLTGAILQLDYVRDTVFPQLEELKRGHFDSHPDDPVILHRKELLNHKHPFESLRDPAVEQSFNREILRLIADLDYTAVTVVLDKLEHQRRYHVWRFDPYHYCLTVMIERYALWLKSKGAVGDVMAESRGGKEDRRLKVSFERAYDRGSDYVSSEVFASCLTSREIKLKAKANNVAGLQLADVIAHPSLQATLARRMGRALPVNFGGEIARILEKSKYYRSPSGQIEGWGRKWLP